MSFAKGFLAMKGINEIIKKISGKMQKSKQDMNDDTKMSSNENENDLDIQTKLNYTRNTMKRHIIQMPSENKSGKYDTSPIELTKTIKNARNHNISLKENGFELVNQESKLSRKDFYTNTDKVKSVYYKEMETLLKEKLGATKVVCFHHQIRSSKKPDEYKDKVKADLGPYAHGINTVYMYVYL